MWVEIPCPFPNLNGPTQILPDMWLLIRDVIKVNPRGHFNIQ